MIVLGIETSGPVCSVALVKGGALLAERCHDVVGQAAESLLGLLEGALSDAGISKQQVERIAAGVGPGSFVGLRVGLAFASGMALGLAVPAVGVSSLGAMAESLRTICPEGQESWTRVCVVDARRGEYFVAAYSERGEVLLSPCAVPMGSFDAFVRERFDPGASILLGVTLDGYVSVTDRRCTVPRAAGVALLGQTAEPVKSPPIPDYIREADAIRPNLPDSPLLQPRV